jgi:hypothetical protein
LLELWTANLKEKREWRSGIIILSIQSPLSSFATIKRLAHCQYLSICDCGNTVTTYSVAIATA